MISPSIYVEAIPSILSIGPPSLGVLPVAGILSAVRSSLCTYRTVRVDVGTSPF